MKSTLIQVKRFNRKDDTTASYPSFLLLGQRHFEKELPSGAMSGKERIFLLPIDLLTLTLPPGLLEGIESVEMVYREKGKVGGGETDGIKREA